MTSLDDLSDAAKIAHRAFSDMRHSKTAHFDRLTAIDAMYESGGAPSLAENLELKKLLGLHDKNVMAFKAAFAAIAEDEEKQTLIELMS